MRFILSLFALGLAFEASAYSVPNPPKAQDGWENINKRKERSYDQYPGEHIWHEGGRPYWKKSSTNMTLTKPAPRPYQKKRTTTEIYKNKTSINLGVKFASGKTTLNPAYTSQLDKVAKALKENRNLKIEIQGHTDNTGNYNLNKSLSEKRSLAVKAYLVSEHGIDSERLEAKGYGPDQPLMDNSSIEGRRQNRRVVGKIINK